MPLLIDGQGDCSHSKIEHLGNDHDARFFRCAECSQVFVVQGGMTLAVPAVQPQGSPAFERDSLGEADLGRGADELGGAERAASD
jgi:hypothetical protein